MLDHITPVVLTRNEEPNIGRTLERLTWAREVIVVDSFSTDRTVTIARNFANVTLLQRAFDEHATQWSFGQSHVRSEWMLALDADYLVPAEMVEELRALSPPPATRGFRAAFRYAIGGKVLRATLYPPRLVLVAAAHARFWQDGHTQRLEVEGATGTLGTRIVHDDRKDFASFVRRQKRYMAKEADKLLHADPLTIGLSGRIRKLMVIAPFAVLLHTLFGKGLVLDGRAGLRYAWERFVAECILSRELLRRRLGRP